MVSNSFSVCPSYPASASPGPNAARSRELGRLADAVRKGQPPWGRVERKPGGTNGEHPSPGCIKKWLWEFNTGWNLGPGPEFEAGALNGACCRIWTSSSKQGNGKSISPPCPVTTQELAAGIP